MNKAVYPFELPMDLGNAAKRLADMEGVSLDEWLTFAIAQKVGSADAVAAFLREASAGATGRDLRYYLDRVPDAPAVSGDELPDGWRKVD